MYTKKYIYIFILNNTYSYNLTLTLTTKNKIRLYIREEASEKNNNVKIYNKRY